MTDFTEARRAMVEDQIARRGVRNPRVLAAMGDVPREKFVARGYEDFAYEDGPLPIACGQTISQPYIVALMLEAADPKPGDRLLEIGTGCGYAAAVAGKVAGQVVTVERHGELAEAARERLKQLGADNVHVRVGDGTGGWPAGAPYDCIVVTAGAAEIPAALKAQLAVGGRLVMPVGAGYQRLVKLTRTGEDTFAEEDLGGVAFVPLVSG